MANRKGKSRNSDRLCLLGLQNHRRWWLQPQNEKTLAPWKERHDKLSILKSRDIILPTKIHIVKAIVFPLVMYKSESWPMKKTECQRMDTFELWCWRKLLRFSWTSRRSNQWLWNKKWSLCSHWLNGYEFEQTMEDSERQGSLACYSPWGRKELDTT